jgi:hypothetical protein
MDAKVANPDSRNCCNELNPAAAAGARIILSMVLRPGVRVSRAISSPIFITAES